MPLILKPIAVHAIVGNAPYIISLAATAAPNPPRTFTGNGAPGSSTLNPGNGQFNGLGSGYLINASLYAAGGGYVVGDLLTLVGGTSNGTALRLTVDMVNASGEIVDFHISQTGNYSAYPSAIAAADGGTGGGAQFLINVPAPDYYLDLSTLTAPVLYVCATSGNSSTSVWAKVSGGGDPAGVQQFKIVSDGGDYWICNPWDGVTQGVVALNIVKPYKLRAGVNAISSETIRGTTYSYAYTPVYLSGSSGPVSYYTRGVSVSGALIETDVVIPDPLAGDIIYALPCTTNIVSGIPVTVQSATVNAGGAGYVSGDVGKVLTVDGGTGAAATLTITAVSSGGAVTGVSLASSGQYTVNPPLTANAATGGTTGAGATFDLTLAGPLIDLNTDARAWAEQ